MLYILYYLSRLSNWVNQTVIPGTRGVAGMNQRPINTSGKVEGGSGSYDWQRRTRSGIRSVICNDSVSIPGFYRERDETMGR